MTAAGRPWGPGALLLAVGSLSACFTPTETTERGMVGVLEDPRGFPLSGVKIDSLEDGAYTDATGAFAVLTQPPNSHVDFQVGATWFTRTYRPEDEGAVIRIRVPNLREVAVACEIDCAARLRWDLGDGLTAKATVSCAEGETRTLRGVPVMDPDAVSCRDGRPVLRLGDGPWRLVPPARRIRVETPPGACVVRIGDRVGRQVEPTVFEAEAAGRVMVSAVCDGAVLPPATLPADATSWRFEAGGPSGRLVLGPGAPQGARLLVRPLHGDEWLVDVPVVDGVIAVPSLPAGDVWVLGPEAAPPIGAATPTWTRTGDGDAATWSIRLAEPAPSPDIGPP